MSPDLRATIQATGRALEALRALPIESVPTAQRAAWGELVAGIERAHAIVFDAFDSEQKKHGAVEH